MKEKLFDLNYHPQLIDIMVKGSYAGAFIVNVFTPILLSIVLKEYLLSTYVYMWLFLNISIYTIRILSIKKMSVELNKKTTNLRIYIYQTIIIVFATSMLYAYALFYSYGQIPDLELFFMATLIVSMIAGSISTLVGVFHAYAVYVVFSSLPIVIIFIYHGSKVFEIFALTTFVFMFVMLKNGFKQYSSIKESILLKESFESRVKESTLKLEEQNKKLNESLHNFQDLQDTSMVMIAFHDKNGLMVNMNQSAVRKFGYRDASEVIGKHIVEFLPEKSLPIVAEAMKNDLSEPYELIMKKRDGTEFPTLVSAKYTTLSGEKVRMTTMMDLSDIKENEKLLQHQSRLAQMGEMISMIAHQWRQPLSAISATSTALNLKAKLGKADNAIVEEMTDKISKYSQHLSQTIDDFREFFKANKEKRETSYDELIGAVLNIIELSITNQNIKLIKDFKSKEKFSSFPNELKQVILNLIKNAEDVLIEKEIKNPFIKIRTYENKGKLFLEISDNAGGVSKNIIDDIFNPYFSTKKQKDGTGLGLYMSKTIVESHCNGALEVFNTKDGALFRITLIKEEEEKFSV